MTKKEAIIKYSGWRKMKINNIFERRDLYLAHLGLTELPPVPKNLKILYIHGNNFPEGYIAKIKKENPHCQILDNCDFWH